jgi:hypothetical protein
VQVPDDLTEKASESPQLGWASRFPDARRARLPWVDANPRESDDLAGFEFPVLGVAKGALRLENDALTLPRPEDGWLMARYNVVAAIFTAVASVEAYASEVVAEPEKRFPRRGRDDAQTEAGEDAQGLLHYPESLPGFWSATLAARSFSDRQL